MRHAPATLILFRFFCTQGIALLLVVAWCVVMEENVMLTPRVALAESLESCSSESILLPGDSLALVAAEKLCPQKSRHTAPWNLVLLARAPSLTFPLAHRGVITGVLHALLPMWRGLIAFPLPPPLPV